MTRVGSAVVGGLWVVGSDCDIETAITNHRVRFAVRYHEDRAKLEPLPELSLVMDVRVEAVTTDWSSCGYGSEDSLSL